VGVETIGDDEFDFGRYACEGVEETTRYESYDIA
jgi:hypothetical protein